MALAAVRSLMHTIYGLVNSSRISVASSTRETLEFAYRHAKSLQIAVLKYDQIVNISEGVVESEARIRDEVRRFEDAIESEASTQFLSQSQSHEGFGFSLNLDHLRDDIHRFAEITKKMGEEYIAELYKPYHKEDEEDDNGGNEYCDMIGLSDQFTEIRDELVKRRFPQIGVKISGMAGIGKTTLARRILHDPQVKANFDCRVYVRIGRKYEMEKVLQAVIAQLNLDEKGDENLYGCLKGRKCLVVLDDVWDFDFYRKFEEMLPKGDKGIRILVISRETHRYLDDDRNCFCMRFLNEDESWELLKKKVFGEEECPYQLEKYGKKIAENCEGLPLLIIAVAHFLSEGEKILEYWNEVAEKQNSVFEDALDQISNVLSPSYHYLPQYLKMNFLYFGAFPQDYMIRRSKIVNLWLAEGFFDPYSGGGEYDELVSRNLVVVRRRTPGSDKTKACNLHCGYRHLNKREVESIKFLHVLNSYGDGLIDSVENHRCLALYKNVLFAIKEVHDSISSISTARSLLCTGPYLQYEVPVCLELRLLRVLDVLTIRFYEFPVEVVELIRLKYLSLTCNANLPPSISKLWNLEYLIVQPHLSIKGVADESYVPVEIWDLQGLVHLQIMGRNLPDPPPGVALPKLRKLLGVGVESCTKGVLQSMPKLERLKIQINDAETTLSFFRHISCLHQLKSLQSVIMYPTLLDPPPTLSISASLPNLEKLSLSGFGYPWEDMSKIAKLPCLKVLKLQCYAFRGEKWEAKEKEFLSLEYLFIEDTDLVQWTAQKNFFAKLLFLSMKNCHNFRAIPQLPFFTRVELVDCDPYAENWVKKRGVNVTADNSWK